MAGQYLYTTKGYNGGWSAAATDLRRSVGGGTWLSVADGNKSAFYRTATGWRRFYSGIGSETSLNISADSFYTIFDGPSGSATASVTIYTDGTMESSGSLGSGSFSVDWDVSNYPDNPDIEIRATLSSGSTPSGPSLNTWHTLNTARGWSLTGSSGLAPECVLSVQLRHVPTAIVLATFDLGLTVIYISG